VPGHPCLVQRAGDACNGGGMLFTCIRYLVHHILDRDAMFAEILRRAIANRYRSAVSQLPSLLLGNDKCNCPAAQLKVMKNERLKSTTVRFRDSDLHLIDRLQEKLGLGMIHVIRLAIRRLAENENLLPSPSAPKKR
jgi:CRP-like cAMP-binding protein